MAKPEGLLLAEVISEPSAGSLDPFNSLPANLDEFETELVSGGCSP
jgi:hypothetical protein